MFDVMRNNITRDDIVINWVEPSGSWGDVQNALQEEVNPNFVNAGNGGLKYRLNAGSPGINAGVIVPGITDGAVGAPDIGAGP